ncbi:MAG TPA: hypothetical protein VK469_03545 [Candidatus Kapabacteria bacterium]|nr:hypothetical protein [Candidatus Kapabacteria bacterium]
MRNEIFFNCFNDAKLNRQGTPGSCGNQSMTQTMFSKGLNLTGPSAIISTNSRKCSTIDTVVTPGFYWESYEAFEICYNDVKISMKCPGISYPSSKICSRTLEKTFRNAEKSFCCIKISWYSVEISFYSHEKYLRSMKLSFRNIDISLCSDGKSLHSLKISLGSAGKSLRSPAISFCSHEISSCSVELSLGSDEKSSRGAVEILPVRYKTVNKKLKIKGGQNAL